MKKNLHTRNSNGFTLIELMIATTLFSVILLLLTNGLIQVSRIYLKGSNLIKTQYSAQNLIESLSEQIQFSGGTIISSHLDPGGKPGLSVFCLDDKRYSYQTGRIMNGGTDPLTATHVLVVDTYAGGCNNATPAQDINLGPLTASSLELMNDNYRLGNLFIQDLNPGTDTIYSISLSLIYGPTDLLDNASHTICSKSFGNGSGGQFCSVTTLSTTVQKRVK
ncbi:MAG: hypothetical protein NVSMB46_00990 [Candidatus Saccharimonadales bacterium]